VILTSVADVILIPSLVGSGWLVPRLPVGIMAGIFAAAVALAFVLDQVKTVLFRRLAMA
jgi:H+-transporting ATPase